MVPSVMPVVRSLRALLWFTASLMLLMLLVVGVGLCVGCQWPVFGGGRWLVPVALSGRVCWVAWAAGDAVGGGGAAGGVGAAGDRVVDGSLWLVWWRGCCCCWLWACVFASSGRGLVVCWFTGFGGFGFLWWQRLPVATLMVG